MRLHALPFLIFAFGCQPIPAKRDLGDQSFPSITLEEERLTAELSESPVRELPGTYERVGAMWDGSDNASIEIAFSKDGKTWSDWQDVRVKHAEVEESVAYVGETSVPDGLARYYKLRGASDRAPRFVYMEFYDTPLDERMEDGDFKDSSTAKVDESEEMNLLTLTSGVAVNARSSWGAKPATCQSGAHAPARLTIHHTVTPTNDTISPEARLRQIQSFHQQSRGWCDIGYHFLISRDGRVWQGRPTATIGAHVANANSGNVGISMMGDYGSTPVNTAQLNAAGELAQQVARQFNFKVNSSTLKGHRDHGGTTCPGNALYAQLGAIRAGGTGSPGGPPSGSFTVKGLVYEGQDTSRRIAGATVTLGGRSTTSDARGYFQFSGVTDRSMEVAASKASYQTGRVNRQAPAGSEVWASISLSPAVATGGLQGVVYWGGNSKNRVASAKVTLSNGQTVVTNASGYFQITGLPVNTYQLSVQTSRGSGKVSRQVIAGQTVWASLAVQNAGSVATSVAVP